MERIEIQINKRDSKGNPKGLRRSGQLPGIVYGAGGADVAVAVELRQFERSGLSRAGSHIVRFASADANLNGDMAIIRELHRPNLAFLPIGGHYTMGPREAALAVELLGVSDVAPIHWGTFPILAGTPAELRAALDMRGLSGVTVHAWSPGDSIRG